MRLVRRRCLGMRGGSIWRSMSCPYPWHTSFPLSLFISISRTCAYPELHTNGTMQIRRNSRRLCRNRPHQPRTLPTQPLLSIPRRLHPRTNYVLTHDPLSSHKTPMLPYLRRRGLRHPRIPILPGLPPTPEIPSNPHLRPMSSHRRTVIVFEVGN